MNRFSSEVGLLGGTVLALAFGLAAYPLTAAGNQGQFGNPRNHGEHEGDENGHRGHPQRSDDGQCSTTENHVCDPDSGATTCPFHLLNTGNGEFVTGTYTVTYLTQICTGGEGSSTLEEVIIRGRGIGDFTGKKYKLQSVTKNETDTNDKGSRTTFLYSFELDAGHTRGTEIEVRAITITDTDGNVTFHSCTPEGDPLCGGGP